MADSRGFVVPPEQDGWRLDKVLASHPSAGSRSRARQAIETGKVSLDGGPCGAEHVSVTVSAGAQVEVDWSRPGTSKELVHARKALTAAGLVVLYDDDDLIAVNKPPGLLTDTATREQFRREDSLRKRLAAMLRAEGDRVRIVHRIDRDTSGVVLAARNEAAEHDLRTQFRNHEPERVYHAFVHGVPEGGEWSDWMSWDKGRNVQRPTPPNADGAVLAACRVEVVSTYGSRAAEIRVHLVTGRRNQIRLQAMLRGHPLLGERLYLPDDWRPNRSLAAPRQALHAARLVVRHPVTGQPVAIEASLAADLLELRRRLAR